MCGDCWNAAMGAPAAVVAARFAWVGYKDRIPFLNRRPDERPITAGHDEPVEDESEPVEHDRDLVEAGAAPPSP